ncbi:lipase family protein [Rhodococcus sp. NPDC127528]|uniref:lipase family protein n=1 Tax=unclassified Rhodococcus (in: high G+C Gram-positive bacteria) TaxID=192944 RepID=UPI0036350607
MGGGVHRAALAIAVAVLTTALAAGASADPIGDLISPPHDPAAVAATPLGAPFFDPPPDFGDLAPGAVLRTRPVTVVPLASPVVSTQILVRSTDAKGQPAAVTATLIVPAVAWTGPGPRPVLAYDMAIDGLGETCAPSYTLQRGSALEVAPIQYFLGRGYAVVVADHEGPRQAYAAGRMAGHAVLDALRATVNTPRFGLAPASPIAITGYSGGAIASGWAAELAPTYAPELRMVGAAFGGTPADYALLLQSMNGRNLASGVLLGATLGVAREYPELFPLFNDNGWRLAEIAKDLCLPGLAVPGALIPLTVQSLSDVPDVVDTPVARAVIAANRLGAHAPTAPVFLYQGKQDPWILPAGAEKLYDDWCELGASVRLEEYVGEHQTVALSGIPAAYGWLDARLAGVPAPVGCSSFGR